ncbi:hypothetical protein [Halorientalis sp.]|jgi:hypothetical protein|uniref:hypothetical protein n=1 Tax=Halorientalis sp. TaxID=1931229 RepID=UPI002605FA84|nr:hypothetical protein [Halorientalis sp.]
MNGDRDTGSRGDPETMRRRVPGGRLRLWILLEAKRWQVSVVILGLIFSGLVVVGAVDPTPLGLVIESSDPIETLFQALVTAIITGVTLVVAINQLVLAQELGPLGDQRERMTGALDTRREIESELEVDVAPADPSAFLQALVESVGERSARLAGVEAADPDVRDRVESFTGDVADNAAFVGDRLADAQFGTFGVVSAALDFGYSEKIYEARRLRAAHADDLPPEADDAFQDLLDVLELFGPAREHIKTLYFQWELIDLSRILLYTALPALVVAVSMIVYFDDGVASWSALGVGGPVWVTSAATTVALVPFVVLVAYILRIVTVAKRTLAIGPFVLRGED